MSKTKALTKRQQAWGEMLAAVPSIRAIKSEVDEWRAEDMPDDEVKRRLRDMAIDDERAGISRFVPGLNRRALRVPAATALVQIAQHLGKQLGKKKLRDVVAEWLDRLGITSWFADYILNWSKTGEPGEFLAATFGGVVDGQLPFTDGQGPYVAVLAGSLSDPDELAREFRKRCTQVMPPETWVRKGFADRDARRFRLFAEGLSDFDIAKAELDALGWQYRAANKREYNAEVESRAHSVLVSRGRWWDYVTGLVEPV